MRDVEVIQEQPDQMSLTERYVEQAVRFIRDHKDGPFFLYFAHMYVNLPLYVPDRFMKQTRNGAYGAAVSCIDWAAGVLLNELERLKRRQRRQQRSFARQERNDLGSRLTRALHHALEGNDPRRRRMSRSNDGDGFFPDDGWAGRRKAAWG
jgi:Sulfatase.